MSASSSMVCRSPTSFAHNGRVQVVALALELLLVCGFDFRGPGGSLRRALTSSDVDARRAAAEELGELRPGADTDALFALAIRDEDPTVRRAAVASAGRARATGAVPILIEQIDSESPEERAGVARALGSIADPSGLATLTRALGDASSEVRAEAVSALARAGFPGTAEVLITRLGDSDSQVRELAARALAEVREPDVLLALVARSRDEASEVRAAVALALSGRSDPSALAALAISAEDDVEAVRVAALRALGATGGAQAEDSLIAASTDSRTPVARTALAGLTRIPGPAAANALIGALWRSDTREVARAALSSRAKENAEELGPLLAAAFERAEDAPMLLVLAESVLRFQVRMAGIASPILRALPGAGVERARLWEALGASGDDAALLPLLEALHSEEEILRSSALSGIERWLGFRGADGRAADPLVSALSRGEHRARIARLLGALGAERALPALESMRRTGSKEERIAALLAIADLGVRSLGLLESLDDPDVDVQATASEALGVVGDVETARELAERLTRDAPTDRASTLAALAEILKRVPDARSLDTLPSLLGDIALARDEEVAAHALHALGAGATERYRGVLIDIEPRLPSIRLPAWVRAVASLNATSEVDGLLRERARAGDPSNVEALAFIGERGTVQDADALLDRTSELRWPANAAAAYSLATLGQRGLLDRRDIPRLCSLARSREPAVRANIALALASLSAPPCEAGNPLEWLLVARSAAIRSASARWVAAAARAGTIPEADARRALSDCLRGEHEERVRALCLAAEGGEEVDDTPTRAVRVRRPGSEEVLAFGWIQVELPDSRVRVTTTDGAGRIVAVPEPLPTITGADAAPLEPR